MKLFYLIIFSFIAVQIKANNLHGVVTEKGGEVLPYASIIIKGTTIGTTANKVGKYSISLSPGKYTIVCQHIGHKPTEKTVTISKGDVELNFELEKQEYKLNEVVVKSGGEDPAYEIIRKAIKNREEHLNEIKKFQCDVYLKGQLQLRNYPKKFFGEKVDFEDGDTSKRKMIFLSETIAKYAVERPNDAKIEVVSTRVSGNSDGFGFSNPQIISFYENIVSLGRGLNPRGFVSPIANNALNFYKYKFDGTYYENGKEISRIKVIPKRKYEPLFSGYISIVENEWRIYSTELYLLKEQQMQLLDTLQIQQLYIPVKDKWVIKQQVIQPAGKIFGFDFFGSFVQVYDQYDIDPAFKKKFFDNVVIKIADSANKKPKTYWDSIRPVPLLEDEARDYVKKDSLEQVRKDPKYLDSLDKVRNKITFSNIVLTGKTFSNSKKKSSLSIDPLLQGINYNTVEGWVLNVSPTYFKRYEGRKSLFVTTNLRYGFNNQHFNAHVASGYTFGKKYLNQITFSTGKKVLQFNNEQPITPRGNTTTTLYYTRNYMKLYEAWFGKMNYFFGLGKGLSLFGGFEYQDRLALQNLQNIRVWRKMANRAFTPNYPVEIMNAPMASNKSSVASIGISFRPGSKYAELPDRTINLGSKYPVMSAQLFYGIKGLLNSDADFSRWQFTISDNLNFKLGGRFSYRLTAGGFLNSKTVFAPDYSHVQGNQIIFAAPYLRSFQLASYYAFSNTSNFMATAHAEYHLNGLITNKIPLLKKWNWFFVLGGSAIHINPDTRYYEAIFSVENIFKVIRVDFVQGFTDKGNTNSGIRINLPGILSGNGD